MEVWTPEIGLEIFASSLTSEKERGQGRKERKGRKATGQKGEGDKKERTRDVRQKRKGTRAKGKTGKKSDGPKGEDDKKEGTRDPH